MGWLEFTAALALFLLSHAIPVRPPVRPWLVRRLGLRGYFTAYSLLSLAILAWLVVAAARAPNAGVLPHWNLFRWAPLLLMPLACLLAVAGVMRQNPFSFGGLGLRAFDPADPGILAVSRHPLLAAMALWAGAHLLANGDLAHALKGFLGRVQVAGLIVDDGSQHAARAALSGRQRGRRGPLSPDGRSPRCRRYRSAPWCRGRGGA